MSLAPEVPDLSALGATEITDFLEEENQPRGSGWFGRRK